MLLLRLISVQFGKEDMLSKLTMCFEYLPTDLSRHIKKNKGSISLNEIRDIMKQLVETLTYMHDFPSIHRDLKPSNVLIDPVTNTVKIADFGLSRLVPKALETMSK